MRLFSRLHALWLLAAPRFAGPSAHLAKDNITYEGTVNDKIEHFLNIRYAHSTSGQRRFAPPDPYTPPANSVIDASIPGAACPQMKAGVPPFIDETPNISEDCLNLRIARPRGTKETDKLPVVVWMHTGGLIKGSAYDSHWEPDRLVQKSVELGKPIIYVAVNYRLTIFGYARLNILEDQKSLNAGFRDQRLAFEWVKENIEHFGGDRDQVTAFGLSAGATMISLHMIAYGGEKAVPFDRAWLMSGPPGTASNMSSDAAWHHTMAVAERIECDTTTEKKILDCLRKVPMEKLLDTAVEYSVQNFPPMGLFTFILCTDGDAFPESATKMFQAGRFAKGIPTVMGWTQDDGSMQTGPAHLINSEEDMIASIRTWAHRITEESLSTIFKLYSPEDFEIDRERYEAHNPAGPKLSIHWFRLARILRDMLFTCPSIDFTYHMAKHSPNTPPSILYSLNQSMVAPMLRDAGMPYLGAVHGSDTNYVFNGVFPEGDGIIVEDDEKLAAEMSEVFIRFAYGGKTGESRYTTDLLFRENRAVIVGDGKRDGPRQITVEIFGGSLGTGPVDLVETSKVGFEEQDDIGFAGELKKRSEGMNDASCTWPTRFEPMKTKDDKLRERELEREKLIHRCAFMNTLTEQMQK